MRLWLDYDSAFPGPEHHVAGTVKVLRGLESPELGNTRDLIVYLPPSYGWTYRTYPVLYMHDGQNLFDAATSFVGEWGVDDTLEVLSESDGIEAIVVGIPNAGNERIAEYGPFEDQRIGGGKADAYLRFLVHTVRPLIESEFRVTRGPASTVVAGSSMGGLVSLYAFFEYPDVFGAVGAFSPSVVFAQGALLPYLEEKPFRGGRIYVDVGTREGYPRTFGPRSKWRLPREYVLKVRQTVESLERKGWTRGRDLLYVEERRGQHDERAWSRRFPGFLRFLFPSRTVG